MWVKLSQKKTSDLTSNRQSYQIKLIQKNLAWMDNTKWIWSHPCYIVHALFLLFFFLQKNQQQQKKPKKQIKPLMTHRFLFETNTTKDLHFIWALQLQMKRKKERQTKQNKSQKHTIKVEWNECGGTRRGNKKIKKKKKFERSNRKKRFIFFKR